jgi:hypothetical protein
MCQHDARISQRYSKESQSSSPVDEPRVYRIGVMGSRDPSQSVGPSNTSPLAVPEAELIRKSLENQYNSKAADTCTAPNASSLCKEKQSSS